MKKIFLLLISICLLTGCQKSLSKEQLKIISNIGITNKEQIVVKYSNKNSMVYDVYSFSDTYYGEIRYMFYDNKKLYDKEKIKYAKNPSYEVKTYDEANTLGIIVIKQAKKTNKTYNTVLNKYKKKKYEIIK